MKKSSLMMAALLATTAMSTFAQGLVQGVTESTDPAKAAAVEQHAAELRAQMETKSGDREEHRGRMMHQNKMHQNKMHQDKMHQDKTQQSRPSKMHPSGTPPADTNK